MIFAEKCTNVVGHILRRPDMILHIGIFRNVFCIILVGLTSPVPNFADVDLTLLDLGELPHKLFAVSSNIS